MGPFGNWKKKSDYPTVKTRPLEIWVWEFLRRNRDYQRDWEFERAHIPNGQTIMGKPSDYAISTNATRKDRTYYIEKYGLPILVNPQIARPEFAFLDFQFTVGRFYRRDSNGEIDELISKSVVAALFNLDYPIKQQLASVKLSLMEFQETREAIVGIEPKGSRLRTVNWVDHLRILDAKALGVSTREIAFVLFRGTTNDKTTEYAGNRMVNDRLNTARYMCEKGFHFIILQEEGVEKRKKQKAIRERNSLLKEKLAKLKKN